MFKPQCALLPLLIVLTCSSVMAQANASSSPEWDAIVQQILAIQLPDGDPVVLSHTLLKDEEKEAVLATAMVQTRDFSQRPGKKITLKVVFGGDDARATREYDRMFEPFELDGIYLRSIPFVGVDRACETNLFDDGTRAIIWQKGRVLVEVCAVHGVETLALRVHREIEALGVYLLPQDEQTSSTASQTVPAGQADLPTQLKNKYDKFVETRDWGILSELETLAKNGDPAAQVLMGRVYGLGAGGVQADPKRAFQWYLLAAQQGQTEAMSHVGRAYLDGQGVDEDPDAGVDWLLKAAERGFPEAQFELSQWYGRDRDHLPNMEISLEWLRKAAEQGYVKAQQGLAGEYSLGWLIPQDYAEAVKWLRRAAEQGDAQSQYMLGDQYDLGKGVAADSVEALMWFLKAAEQGYTYAQFVVGERYQYGVGAAKNLTEAAAWYRKAAENGNATSMERLGAMYEKGEGVPQDVDEAIRWYRKAVATSEHATDAKKALKRLGAD